MIKKPIENIEIAVSEDKQIFITTSTDKEELVKILQTSLYLISSNEAEEWEFGNTH